MKTSISKQVKKFLKNKDIWGVTCGYLYRNGILLYHWNSTDQSRKEEHLFLPFQEGEAPVFNYNHGKDFSRIVFLNPTLLLQDIDRIDIYFNNSSDNAKKKDISYNTLTITYKNGMRVRLDEVSYEGSTYFHSSEFCIQTEGESIYKVA